MPYTTRMKNRHPLALRVLLRLAQGSAAQLLVTSLVGCGHIEPDPAADTSAAGPPACVTVLGSVATDECAPDQLSATRCSVPIEIPDAELCTGPADDPGQEVGSMWCCRPRSDLRNCYVEPSEARCPEERPEPVYCHAPQASPDPTCAPLEVGGSQWCCGLV